MSHATHSHDLQPPKPVLFAMGVLLTGIVAFVGFSQLTGIGVAKLSSEAPVERLEVRFADESDGGVGAYDPVSGEALHIFGPGEGGFVRSALRSLGHNRRLQGVGPMPAYELHRSATGNVVLFDPTTQKSLTLNAFGNANEGDFAQLFAMQTERELP